MGLTPANKRSVASSVGSKHLVQHLACLCIALCTPFVSAATATAATQLVQPQTSTSDPELVGYDANSFESSTSDYQHIEQQIDLGELREARTELETTIGALQRTGDRYDGALVEPLRLLGRVFHEEGDYPRAAETLALATQISRVANGLHSAEQLHLVHQEIRSLKAMGNIVEANRRHEYAFSIARRHFGRFGEELIPELLKIGVWYTSTGDVIGARDRFAEARLLLSAKPETAESDDMLFALKGIARSYRDEAFPPFFSRSDKETQELYARNGLTDRQAGVREQLATRASINSFHRGSEALIDIVRIEVNRLADIQDQMLASAQQQSVNREEIVQTSARRRTTTLSLEELATVIESPEANKRPFIESLLELGDWYLLINNTDPVNLLGKPTLLYFPRPRDPRTPETAPKESFEQGFVELKFDVDHRGEVKRLRTLQSQPKGMMDFNVRSSAKVSRYRPRIVDGLPQPTTEQIYRHKFDYFPRGRDANPPRVIDSDAQDTKNKKDNLTEASPTEAADGLNAQAGLVR